MQKSNGVVTPSASKVGVTVPVGWTGDSSLGMAYTQGARLESGARIAAAQPRSDRSIGRSWRGVTELTGIGPARGRGESRYWPSSMSQLERSVATRLPRNKCEIHP